VSWDFWRRVDELDKRTSDPERIARNARAGFAANNESFLGSDLFRKASSTGCRGSNDCGSGFACIDGRCTKIFTRNGGNWTPNSCGDDNVTWVCTKGEKSGSNDKCSRPTPGNCDPDPTCPGARCCRQQRDGSIRCVCGSCEQTDTSRCNVYCDQQYKAFGTVSAGCYTRDMDGFGECGGNICDECQFCENDFFGSGGTCETGEQGDAFNPLPCHCFDKCSEECHICNKDPDSANFGECEYSPQDCMQCCYIYNYDCPQCARYFPGAQHHCEPVTSGKPCIQALREKLYKQCQSDCATKPDPCAPTGSFSRCVDGSAPVDPDTNPGGPSTISCPQGKTCQYAGYLEVGGDNPTTCYFYNTWVTDDIPEKCKECDCNCSNDCGDCETCNAQGECEEVLGCKLRGGWWRWRGTANGTPAASDWVLITQPQIEIGYYLELTGYQPPGWSRHYSRDTYGGGEWWSGPITFTRKDNELFECEGYGTPYIWLTTDLGVSSGEGLIGFDEPTGQWLDVLPSCDDPIGYSVTYDGGWEYGGDGAQPPNSQP
jgi:hypothetical protein